MKDIYLVYNESLYDLISIINFDKKIRYINGPKNFFITNGMKNTITISSSNKILHHKILQYQEIKYHGGEKFYISYSQNDDKNFIIFLFINPLFTGYREENNTIEYDLEYDKHIILHNDDNDYKKIFGILTRHKREKKLNNILL